MSRNYASRSRFASTRSVRALAWTFCGVVALTALFAGGEHAAAQPSEISGVSEEVAEKLKVRGELTLRDTNYVEAMRAIRRAWGVGIVVSNELKGETVNCEFVDAPLYEILDALLTPRGFGYKTVGNTLVIVKSETLGAYKPMFRTESLLVKNGDLNEISSAVEIYLSPQGKLQIVASAKRLMVHDFPDRIEQIRERVEELDAAAKEIRDEAKVAEDEERRVADAQGGAGTGLPGGVPGGPLAPEMKVVVFDLDHIRAEVLAPSIQPIVMPGGQISVLPKENRVVAVAPPDRIDQVIEAVKQLDVPRSQVRISALIYDASLEDVRRLGVNWNSTGKGNLLDAQGVPKMSAGLGSITAANPSATAVNGALTLTSLSNNFDLRMVVNALATSRQSRLLANPAVTVYDAEEANLAIVQEVPFQQLTQGLGGGSIGTTAFREAGVSLKVTPWIARDQTIVMTVNPKFSVLTGFTPNNAPIIDRRETTTTVRVEDGGTLVLGGLRQRNSSRNNSGIPFLKDIKGVGELFKFKDANARESELVVFLTPTLLDIPTEMDDRRACINEASKYSLDAIPSPRTPLRPCPPDDWKHRCGLHCKHCRDGACGDGCVEPRIYRDNPQLYEGGESSLESPNSYERAVYDNAPLPPPPVNGKAPPASEPEDIAPPALDSLPTPVPDVDARRGQPSGERRARVAPRSTYTPSVSAVTPRTPAPSAASKPAAPPRTTSDVPARRVSMAKEPAAPTRLARPAATPPVQRLPTPNAESPRGRITRGYSAPDVDDVELEDIEPVR